VNVNKFGKVDINLESALDILMYSQNTILKSEEQNDRSVAGLHCTAANFTQHSERQSHVVTQREVPV
jgi:hypothetical protein